MRQERADAGVVALSAAAALRAAPDVIIGMLGGNPPGWDLVETDGETRRYAVDLRLRVGGEHGGLATFRKAAYVDLGTPARTSSGAVLPIGWRASTAAPLFPVFAGSLRVDGRTLEVRGMYAPPGGAIGRMADRALFHVAATGTARWLLGEIDRLALDAA